MQAKRGRVRIAVDIPVTITTVLDSLDATVVNLSQSGALVEGASLPKGSMFQLDCDGHSTFARVMWSEIDRMGVRFPFDMQDGPLFEKLEQARNRKRQPDELHAAAMSASGGALGLAYGGSFGRRIG